MIVYGLECKYKPINMFEVDTLSVLKYVLFSF